MRHSCLLHLLVLAAVAGTAYGQGSEDVNAGQFDFSLPGARSLAMGGAFVALADDATAAYSNPAGLILLGRPEVSAEFRSWSFAATAIDRGHAFGSPTGIGLDTIAGLVEKEFESDTSGVSFLSVVYPWEKWAFGLFRHEFPKFDTKKEIQGAFFDCSGGFFNRPPSWDRSISGPFPPGGQEPYCSIFTEDTGGIDRVFPKLQQIEIDISSVGVTFAYKVNENFSLGISGLYYDFSIDSVNRVLSVRDDPFGPADPAEYEHESTQDGDDNAFAVNAGIRWQFSQKWILGAAYRQGPRFDFVDTIVAGPRHLRQDLCPPGSVCAEFKVPFRVPDTYVIGVAYRPIQVWTFMFQYDLVEFSSLLQDFKQTSGLVGSAAQAVNEGLTIDDAHRFRLGFEYIWLNFQGNAIAFRGGAWHDTDHRAHFRANPDTGLPFPRYALFFPEGDEQTHITAGVGLVVQPRFQIDAGIDFSDLRDTVSLSAVWKF